MYDEALIDEEGRLVVAPWVPINFPVFWLPFPESCFPGSQPRMPFRLLSCQALGLIFVLNLDDDQPILAPVLSRLVL